MKQMIFRVVETKKLPIDWKLEELQKFPTHTHELLEKRVIWIVYDYKPSLKFNEAKFVEFITSYLKKKYHTNSVDLKSL